MSFSGKDIKHKFLQCFSKLLTTKKMPKEDKTILKTSTHYLSFLRQHMGILKKKMLPRVQDS